VLGSAFYLGISLVCTNGTPVADMLAHSPPLPLVIDYFNDITVEDEEGAILSLKQYDRVRHVRFKMPPTRLQKLIVAMDDEYPILEYLIIAHPVDDKTTILMFPETLQAPHLRHLLLVGFALPIGSRLLTTAVGLVTLCLGMVHLSTYFHPDTLLQWLSFMPQLETLLIDFEDPVPDRDAERQLTHTPNTIPAALAALPNLHVFRFSGVTPFLEALVRRIAAPHLEKLELEFFNQLTYSVPRLLHFVNTTQNLRFQSAKFEFSDEHVNVEVYPHEEAEMYALSITVDCWHLERQVSSAAQIFYSLSSVFSAVEHLFLKHEVHSRSTEEHKAEPIKWRKLLNSFRNVKTLRVAEGLVEEISRCLQLDDGELPFELLPELQELAYSGSGDIGDAFTSFVEARQVLVGRTITLLRRSPSPDPSFRAPSLEPFSIIPASGEAGSDFDT
jgi:hypothetical protein